MFWMRSVRKVKARNIHPGIQEGGKHFNVVGCRTKRAYDLGPAPICNRG